MFCQVCGKKKIGEGKFCPNCGESFAVGKLERKSSKVNLLPLASAGLLLLLATFSDSLAIGFFTFLRWIVMGASVYYAYDIYKRGRDTDFWFWIFVVLAVLFNPFVPIHLARDTWQFIDFVVAAILVAFGSHLKKAKLV